MSSKLIVATALAVTGVAAMAQTQNYLALSGGVTKHQQDCVNTTVCDRRGNAFRFFMGQPLSEELWAELAYLDFGKARMSSPARSMTISAAGVGGGLAMRRELPSKWVLAGRLGLSAMIARGNLVSPTRIFSGSEHSVAPYVGVSLGYKVHPSMALNVNFDGSRVKFNRMNVDASRGTYSLTIGATIEF